LRNDLDFPAPSPQLRLAPFRPRRFRSDQIQIEPLTEEPDEVIHPNGAAAERRRRQAWGKKEQTHH
jgi:hypothetical protein